MAQDAFHGGAVLDKRQEPEPPAAAGTRDAHHWARPGHGRRAHAAPARRTTITGVTSSIQRGVPVEFSKR
jgi:hypothetical protein